MGPGDVQHLGGLSRREPPVGSDERDRSAFGKITQGLGNKTKNPIRNRHFLTANTKRSTREGNAFFLELLEGASQRFSLLFGEILGLEGGIRWHRAGASMRRAVSVINETQTWFPVGVSDMNCSSCPRDYRLRDRPVREARTPFPGGFPQAAAPTIVPPPSMAASDRPLGTLPPFSAVYDANVLYPAPLRDLLVRLARTDRVRAYWTDRIHEEWITSVLTDRPDLERSQLERTRSLMDRAILEPLVTGYEHRIPDLSLPDPGDRHVLAAALEAEVDTIVTFNLEDFPAEVLAPRGLVAQHPDEWICEILEEDRETVLGAARRQRAALTAPPQRTEEFLDTLERQGLERLRKRLEDHADQL